MEMGMRSKSFVLCHLKQMMRASLRTSGSRHGAHNPDHAINIEDMHWSIVPKM